MTCNEPFGFFIISTIGSPCGANAAHPIKGGGGVVEGHSKASGLELEVTPRRTGRRPRVAWGIRQTADGPRRGPLTSGGSHSILFRHSANVDDDVIDGSDSTHDKSVLGGKFTIKPAQ